DDDIVVPLESRGRKAATLRLGIDPAHLAKASVDLMLEVASEMLVSVLITFEVLLLVVHLSLAKVNALRHAVRLAEAGDFRAGIPAAPGSLGAVADACRAMLDRVNRRFAGLAAEARAELGVRFRFRGEGEAAAPQPVNLVYLRLPVFLFCLSEELSRPFMPAYAQNLAPTAPWLPPDLAVGLPITLFMLVWALSQPLGARLSGRVGRWRAFAAAAGLAAFGLAMTALTDSLLGLLAWRCVTALGYGVALITAQGIVVDHTTADNRAGGLALFIGALLAAGVCGPVTGGIIADQAGASATLLVGAGLALLSAAVLYGLFGRTAAPPSPSPIAAKTGALSSSSAWRLAGDLRFVLLMALSAMPAKIAATGVLFCLAPLLLAESGAGKAEIGRVQMMYFLAFILVSPLAASLSDRWGARRGFVVAGGVGTLVGVLPIVLLTDGWAAPLAIGLFGAAQALIGAPQLTLLTRIAARAGVAEIAAIGWYRLL
ncbi:MFS transporter, partial [bacterium]|nr:MFS transporter [bacterium]